MIVDDKMTYAKLRGTQHWSITQNKNLYIFIEKCNLLCSLKFFRIKKK